MNSILAQARQELILNPDPPNNAQELIELIQHRLAPQVFLDVGSMTCRAQNLKPCQLIYLAPNFPTSNITLLDDMSIFQMDTVSFFSTYEFSGLTGARKIDMASIHSTPSPEAAIEVISEISRFCHEATVLCITEQTPIGSITQPGEVLASIKQLLEDHCTSLLIVPVRTCSTEVLLVSGLGNVHFREGTLAGSIEHNKSSVDALAPVTSTNFVRCSEAIIEFFTSRLEARRHLQRATSAFNILRLDCNVSIGSSFEPTLKL